MLDIKFIKDNTQLVKKALNSRGKNYDLDIDKVLELDAKRREILTISEEKKAKQNKVTKQIPLMKKNGENTDAIMLEMKNITAEIKDFDIEVSKIEKSLKDILLSTPNMPNECVPIGKDETDNIEIRKVGTAKTFDFDVKPHWDIGEDLDILDPTIAAKVTGSRFHFYKGLGAKLERAVINYFLDTHGENGYTEIFPPFLANKESMLCTGQLPKFEDDMFAVGNYFLIPTAEVPITNMHRDEIVDILPKKYCAYSACFRAEAGSAGRDARGLIRQHQFNKVELVKFSKPENSYEELEKLTKDAERVLSGLGLAYRVVLLCTGDMGFSSACTYDIEVWMPSYNRYVEISSCSNFQDYQARRGMIRYRAEDGKAKLLHTLNGSGVAIGRTVAAILENYQNKDGSITIPTALVKYMNTDKITKN